MTKPALALVLPPLRLVHPLPEIRTLPVEHDLGETQLVLGLPLPLVALDGGREAELTAPDGPRVA